MAMYLHEGRLPWSDLPAKTGPEPDVAIHRAKVRVPPLQLVGPALSTTVGALLEATRALQHAERPDYAALKRLLTDGSEPPDVGSRPGRLDRRCEKWRNWKTASRCSCATLWPKKLCRRPRISGRSRRRWRSRARP